MADFCTCGAELPSGARFCHRCGKPQFADPPPEFNPEFQHPSNLEHSGDDLRALATEAQAAPATGPAPISFHNANAVRAGFVAAIIIWLLMIIPIGGVAGMFLKLFVLLGGGSLAVFFYSKRTGQVLSVSAGARLGWITGVLFYVIWILFFTVTIIVLQDQGGIIEAYRKQLQESNAPADTVKQLTEIMQSPEAFGALIVMMLAMVFVAFTLPMILGGAVAAKALEHD
ncbi:MAG: hypothetical protein HYX27_20415 [Acidobacteria bacterium]|nr:hypothetical protein [Acidobacteriota bacterium]